MTPAAPVLSVIVPAYQCAPMLRRCLAGLVASDLPRAQWELLVVDDGSSDDTPAVAAASADTVLRVPDGPRGPAQARNVGARAARGDLLVFIDADVVVARHTLRGFADLFRTDPTLAAAFGAYDDQPADPGFVSQYRNLLHRYVHLRHAGDAETFWAGCGAVRRADFLAVGGFDAARYPRPQIEDIELGYRLRDRGARIRLEPTLTGTHLKRWTLGGMLRVDLCDRAIPWTRLLLARRARLSHAPLNLAPTEKVLTALAGTAVAGAVIAAAVGEPAWLWLATACIGIIVLGNAPLWRWLAERRGWAFAIAAMPLRVLFYVVSALGAAWAVLFAGGRRPRAIAPTAADPVSEPGAPG